MLKRYGFVALAAIFIVIAGWFWSALRPVGGQAAAPAAFAVKSGDGFAAVADHLAAQGLVRSASAFKIFLVIDGLASSLQPGLYRLSPAMSGPAIARALTNHGDRGVTVTIPEGSDIFQIDRILSDALVTPPGSFTKAANAAGLEGRLFPDTYQFVNGEPMGDILETFAENFDVKARPLFAKNATAESSTLIIASVLEKEAPNPTDQRIIAGIIVKRLAAGMTLDIDATVCYAEELVNPLIAGNCASLTKTDFAIDSPYNTYLHHGLPPTPIGNPGIASIEAALQPAGSPYWFYVSDPKTGKIIYAKTLEEQNRNIAKYLR